MEQEIKTTLKNFAKVVFYNGIGFSKIYNVTSKKMMSRKKALKWTRLDSNRIILKKNPAVGDKNNIKYLLKQAGDFIKNNPVEYIQISILAAKELYEEGYDVMVKIETTLEKNINKINPKIITKKEADILYNKNKILKRKKRMKFNSDYQVYDGVWVQIDDIIKFKEKTKIITKVTSWVMKYINKKDIEQFKFTGIKDVDHFIMLDLSYKDVLSLCKVSKYNSALCAYPSFWQNKMKKDFPLRSKYLYFDYYERLWKENPRKLYEIINTKSKIITLTLFDAKWKEGNRNMKISNDYWFKNMIEMKTWIPDQDEAWEPKAKDKVMNGISDFLNILPLLRGDVIYLSWIPNDRNNGKFMWDGEQVIDLHYEVDEYGTASEEFTFPEFPLDYFHNSIGHNYIIWLSKNTLQEAVDNFDEITQKSFITDQYNSYKVKTTSWLKITKETFSEYINIYGFIHKNEDYEEVGVYVMDGNYAEDEVFPFQLDEGVDPSEYYGYPINIINYDNSDEFFDK